MKLKLNGLTLAELVVVFFIIGILVATATPSASRLYEESRLRRRATEVLSYLRQARQYAVTEQSIYGVKLDITNNLVYLLHLTPDPADPGQYIENQVSVMTIESPLTIASTSLSTNEVLTFNAVGNPSKSADIVLADDESHYRTICVNAAGSIELRIASTCS